ncbi:MAG TPA: hypothetical protein VKR52_20350 [Terracidiphilus sp.]|nr:hypothetical protein [Terracidiphilus sp.]
MNSASNTQTILLIVFVAITGLAVLLQASVLLGMFIAMRKSLKLVQENVDELRTKVLPVVTDAGDFFTRVGPKLESMATDMSSMMHDLREQGAELQESATVILEKVQRQSSRVDSMMTGFLDSVDRAGAFINDVVGAPIRQLGALAAAAKAMFGALTSRSPEPAATHASADKDLFV